MISMDTFGEIDRLLKFTGAELNLRAECFAGTWTWKLTIKRLGDIWVHESDPDLVIVFRRGLRVLSDLAYKKDLSHSETHHSKENV